ncbi:MAG: hypothetical protein AAFZ89_08705 [Bacteroidota bacterium]
MSTFEDLQSQWKNQPEPQLPRKGSEMIIGKVTELKRKQRIANLVLSVTILILIGFFMYISAYKESRVMWALFLMIATLIVRVIIEAFSIRWINKLKVAMNAHLFRERLIDYYKGRAWVHYVITPLLILAYIYGFMVLLPFFKASLSPGFYTYIVISSIVSLIVLGTFIAKQIRKEMRILGKLKNM